MSKWLLLGVILILFSLSALALPYNDTLTNDNGIIITSNNANFGGVNTFEIDLEIQNTTLQEFNDIVLGIFVNPDSRNNAKLSDVKEFTLINRPIRIPVIDSNTLTSTQDFVLCSDRPRGCIQPIPIRFNGSLVLAGGLVRTPRQDRGTQCVVLVGSPTDCWYYSIVSGYTLQNNYVENWVSIEDKITDRQFRLEYQDFVFNKAIYPLSLVQFETKKLKLKIDTRLFKNGEITFVAKSLSNPQINSVLHPWFNNSWNYKKQISIATTHSLIDANFTYNIQLNTAALVSAGKLQSNCNDLRIVYNNTTALDMNVLKCNATDTNVLFRSQAILAANTADAVTYQLYYGNSSATQYPNDLNKVFMWYDNFDDNSFNWPFQDEATETNGVLWIKADSASDISGANFPLYLGQETFVEYRVATNVNDEGGYVGIADDNVTTTAPTQTNAILFEYIGFSSAGVLDGYANVTNLPAIGTYAANTYQVMKLDYNSFGVVLSIDGVVKGFSSTKPNVVTAHPFLDVFCSGVGGLCSIARIDLNVDWIKVQHWVLVTPITSLGGEETFLPSFAVYPDTNVISFQGNSISVIGLNPNLGINSKRVDFNALNITPPAGSTIIARYWKLDDVNVSTDVNYFTTFASSGLHKTCYDVYYNNGSSDVNAFDCKYFKIDKIPQDVNFTWIPISASQNGDVNFFGVGTDENSPIKYAWQDGSTYFSSNKDTNRNFATQGIKQIKLTLTDTDDMNSSVYYNVSVVGRARFQFYDENSGAGVKPTLLTINGQNYANVVDGNGLVGIDFNSSFPSDTYVIVAGLTNYGTRSWAFDLNAVGSYDYNFAMLQSSRGQDINFQWYDWNGVALPNARIFIGAPQSNNLSGLRRNFYSGSCETDAEAKCSFFLNGNDLNYSLRALTDSSITWDYNYTRVSVKIPKDERTLASLSPFRVDYSIIGAKSFIGQVADVNTNILPNTLDYYDIKVDFNTLYYPRHFFTRTQGNPVDLVIQPYLVDSTYGISSKFFTIDVATQKTIPNVEIITSKTIPSVNGSNLILMEQVVSDGSGTTNASFITGDTYQADFYFNRVLLFSGTITANSTTYYARLDFGGGIQQPNYLPLDVNFNSLGFDTFVEADSNGIISLTQQVIGTYSLLNIKIINNANVVWDVNHSTGSQFTESFDANSVNLNYPIEITYTIWQAGSSRQWNKSYNVVGINSNQYTLVGDLQAMKGEVLGDSGAMILALILAMVGVAMVASYVGFDTNFLAIIGFIILGFFWYVSWIPTFWFALAGVVGAGAMILKARL